MTHVLDIPPARAGEKILPAYNALAAAVRAWKWFKGDGVRVVDTPLGAIIIRVPEPKIWHHPWRVDLDGDQARVAPGVVNGAMPWIGKSAMDGLDADGELDPDGIPRLTLDDGIYLDGSSWIALRMRCDADLKLLPVEQHGAEIVQTTARTWGAGYTLAVKTENGWQGDFPLALLRRTGSSGFGQVFQFAHFNIRCRVRPGKFWFFV